MTADLTPTFTDRLADPKTAAMIGLGLLGVGILIGWKLAGGEPVILEDRPVVLEEPVFGEEPPFPFIPPYNAAEADLAASDELTE